MAPEAAAPATNPLLRDAPRKVTTKPLATRPKVEKATQVSLKEVFNHDPSNLVESKEEVVEDAGKPVDANLPRDPYTPEEFAKAWHNYCAVVKREDNLSTYATLSVRLPQVNAEHEIQLIVTNDYQIKYINEVREQLLTYIRKALNNHAITLNTRIVKEEAAQVQHYSDKDKYNALAEEFPVLEKLRKALGLDVEF